MFKVRGRYGVFEVIGSDTVISRSMREYGEWAEGEVSLFKTLVRPGDCVIDVGAFIGTHSVALGKLVGPSGEVFSFEPRPEIYAILVKNVHNNTPDVVKTYNLGLAEKDGVLTTHSIDTNIDMNYGGLTIREGDEYVASKINNTVNLKALDSLSLPKISFIKVDVEGMEQDVLNGGDNLIARDRPKIYIECNNLDKSAFALSFCDRYEYRAFGYVFNAFNEDNFFKNSSNFLGKGREMGILLLPVEVPETTFDQLSSLLSGAIVTLDDIVLQLLHVPQYSCDHLTQTASADVIGTKFTSPYSLQLESEIQELEDLRILSEKKIADLQQELRRIESSSAYKFGMVTFKLIKFPLASFRRIVK